MKSSLNLAHVCIHFCEACGDTEENELASIFFLIFFSGCGITPICCCAHRQSKLVKELMNERNGKKVFRLMKANFYWVVRLIGGC